MKFGWVLTLMIVGMLALLAFNTFLIWPLFIAGLGVGSGGIVFILWSLASGWLYGRATAPFFWDAYDRR